MTITMITLNAQRIVLGYAQALKVSEETGMTREDFDNQL